MSEINLVCAADLHLGRCVGPQYVGQKQKSFVIQAWERLVDACIDDRVDALLLAGDMIDENGLFIEVYGVFKKGILKLLERGITVVAIAGNHDAKVLNQFHRDLHSSNFCLLGRDGNWERKSFEFKGKTVHVDGISFTESFMMNNPFSSRTWEKVPQEDILIGLLHCDVDATESKYAPVRSSDFKSLPHNMWVLGHIHKAEKTEKSCARYCGSLQGLDIGSSECGPHGAWKLTVDPSGVITSTFLPLAPLRWEQVSIDLSKISSQDWESQLLKKIEEKLTLQIEDPKNIEMIGVRLTFEGRTALYRELRRTLSKIQGQENARVNLGGAKWIPYFVESIKNNTRPELDLRALAEGKNIVATLARKLLEGPSEKISEHVQEKLGMDPFLKRCSEVWPGEEECLELYITQGYELLDELLEQNKL